MDSTEAIAALAADTPALVALRRDIHAHPELAFDEHRTAELIARTLENWGIPVHRGLGKTGLVGTIRSGSSNRAIGLRADMDALPLTESNAFAHASVHRQAMHACGHDGHVTMLLAAARYLSRHRNFDGTVYLIFQPAEEGGNGGARRMIEDGLFTSYPMDAIFGIHNWPGLAAGKFAVCAGPVFASGSKFRIEVRGKGAHAAMPQEGIDPIPVACQIVQGFQTILTRNKRPTDTAVISVTMIHAGEAVNVIPDRCEIQGTVRTFSAEVLNLVEQRMRQVSESTCETFGATCDFDFNRYYPSTINHPAEAAFVRDMLVALVGETNVEDFEPTMTSEDFSFYLLEKPGCYFLIGNGLIGNGSTGNVPHEQEQRDHREIGHGSGPCTLHNPSYDFNDSLIPLGGAMWARLVEAWMPR